MFIEYLSTWNREPRAMLLAHVVVHKVFVEEGRKGDRKGEAGKDR